MKAASDPKAFSLALAGCLAGPLIWSAHFFSMYAAATLACRAAGAGPFLIVTGIITLAALAALVAVLMHQWRAGQRRTRGQGSAFLHRLAVALGALSILAVLWTALPAMLVFSCEGPV